VAVIALKGGSGKTTVATHLAIGAHLRGVDVLVADTDPQGSSKEVLSAREGAGPALVSTSGAQLMAAQFAAVGLRKELFIIDTPAGAVEDVGEAIVLSDLVVMVVRPTLLDLAGLVRSLTLVRRIGKPSTVILNQAPVAREGVESPLVQRIKKGLDYMQAPVAPVVLRSRAIYQTALERGRSAEEMHDRAAAREISALWDFIAARLEEPTAGAERA